MAFDRRSLLLSSSLGGAGLALGCDDPAPKNAQTNQAKKGGAKGAKAGAVEGVTGSKAKAAAQVATLVAIADRILPPEPDREGPAKLGAKALGAQAYFETLLADKRMAHLRRPLLRGVDFLDRGAKLESKVAGFSALTSAKQDSWLQRLNTDKVRPNGFRGSQFMRVMCALTLEAALGAPAHGGNAKKQAWTWLEYSEHGRGVPT